MVELDTWAGLEPAVMEIKTVSGLAQVFELTLTDSTGSAVDLTGVSFRGAVNTAPLHEFIFSVENGKVLFGWTGLPAGRHSFDLFLVTGSVERAFLRGSMVVSGRTMPPLDKESYSVNDAATLVLPETVDGIILVELSEVGLVDLLSRRAGAFAEEAKGHLQSIRELKEWIHSIYMGVSANSPFHHLLRPCACGLPWTFLMKSRLAKSPSSLPGHGRSDGLPPPLLLKMSCSGTNALLALSSLGHVLLEKINVLDRSPAGNITRASQFLAFRIHHDHGRNACDFICLGLLGFAEIGTAKLKLDAYGHAVHALLEFLLGKDFLLQLDAVTTPGRSREKKDNGKAGFLRLLLGGFQALAPAEFHLRRLGCLGGGFLVRGSALSQGNSGHAESQYGAQCKNKMSVHHNLGKVLFKLTKIYCIGRQINVFLWSGNAAFSFAKWTAFKKSIALSALIG